MPYNMAECSVALHEITVYRCIYKPYDRQFKAALGAAGNFAEVCPSLSGGAFQVRLGPEQTT